jgi:Response regulator containing CheY-like receiver, AAA-type ATPase, and DNA-binding domains
MVAELERAGFSLGSVVRVETPDAFTSQLSPELDVILCDYALPSFSAPDALRLLQQRGLDIPFIIVSGSIGEEVAVDAIKHGADDYLLKDRLGRLGRAVSQAIEEKKLRAAAARAEEDLRQSEYKYRCLFEHLPDAAYLCDATSGRIIDVNPRGETFLRRERARVLGSKIAQFLPAETTRDLLTSANTSPPPELDTVFHRPDDAPLPVHLRSAVVPLYNRRLLLLFVRPAA